MSWPSKQASTKFRIELVGGKYVAKAADPICSGEGLNGYQHRVKCCKSCHAVRCDNDKTAKTAILLMDKLVHATALLGKNELSKSDVAFLQHNVIERPRVFGNEAFTRFKEAVKTRLQAHQMSDQLPAQFKGMAGEDLLRTVVQVYH